MNVFAKFDEITSMILQDIKETKRYGHTVGRTDGRMVGQRENSIHSHKHSLRGYNNMEMSPASDLNISVKVSNLNLPNKNLQNKCGLLYQMPRIHTLFEIVYDKI